MKPEDFIPSYEKALASQDWSVVAPLIHPDCTVTFSTGTTHRGKDNVRKAFQKNFDLIEGEKYFITDLHWIVKTDGFAVFTFVYNWSGKIQGELLSGNGRGSSTIMYDAGTWILVSEHLGAKA
ncbi:MAG: YybH family protein [Luteolibacter sp.]